MTLLKVSAVTKLSEDGTVLNGISFTQRKLEKIAIAGETGSGKTTLLKIIAGLVLPDSGNVSFQNQKVKGPDEKLVPGHPRIAYLSQHFELPKFLRVEQVLSYANKMTPQRSLALYEVCRISHLLKRKTDQLSGGEMQRIAMARLLISSPKLLLLDEPFTHLDMVHKNILKSVIRDISEKLKITCVLISHDPADTLSWADQIVVLKEGEMQQKGSPEDIYRNPVNEYVAGLFGEYNTIRKGSKLFSMISDGRSKSKTILIRPESIIVSKKGKSAVSGKVRKVNFLGSHYEIEIAIGKDVLLAKTGLGNIVTGDVLNVSFIDNGTVFL
jgi:ABC-type glutathione transport system ATPase component